MAIKKGGWGGRRPHAGRPRRPGDPARLALELEGVATRLLAACGLCWAPGVRLVIISGRVSVESDGAGPLLTPARRAAR